MSSNIKNVSDIVNKLTVTSLNYADDIGLDEKSGLGVSGYINSDGKTVKIRGSVIIENNSPVVNDKDTSFHLYENGLAHGSEEILNGTKAILAMKRICEKENFMNHSL